MAFEPLAWERTVPHRDRGRPRSPKPGPPPRANEWKRQVPNLPTSPLRLTHSIRPRAWSSWPAQAGSTTHREVEPKGFKII